MNGYSLTICGIGEALFDIFDGAQVLGGAPLNVAVHAHQLAAKRHGRGIVVSRVGQDLLGNNVCDALKERQMDTQYIQSDPDHATGQVYVQTDYDGQPSYDIVANAAWDWMQFDPDMQTLAQQCDAVCFGSLAQREAQSRNSIYRFLDACRPSTIRLFDVNIRLEFYTRQIIMRSLELANALKLNEEELPLVCKLTGLGTVEPGSERDALLKLMKQFKINWIIYTRGAKGTTIHTPAPEGVFEGTPAQANPVEGADAVGAGDSVAATCLVGAVLRKPWQQIADLANKVGAYVASQPGATPALPDDLISQL
jgi:fructokinase